MLGIFYQSVVVSATFFAFMCLGSRGQSMSRDSISSSGRLALSWGWSLIIWWWCHRGGCFQAVEHHGQWPTLSTMWRSCTEAPWAVDLPPQFITELDRKSFLPVAIKLEIQQLIYLMPRDEQQRRGMLRWLKPRFPLCSGSLSLSLWINTTLSLMGHNGTQGAIMGHYVQYHKHNRRHFYNCCTTVSLGMNEVVSYLFVWNWMC